MYSFLFYIPNMKLYDCRSLFYYHSGYFKHKIIYHFQEITHKISTMPEPYKTVQTEYGPVRGQLKSTAFDGKPYYSFRGIRYAQPPLNHLRFKVFRTTLYTTSPTFWAINGTIFPRILFSHLNHRYHGLRSSMHLNMATNASRKWL